MQGNQDSPQTVRGHKPLVVILILSAIFLVVAVGVGVWLVTKPAGSTIFTVPIGDGTDSVKKVSFVPVDLAGFTKRDQNTTSGNTTYYYDGAHGCGFVTHAAPIQAGVPLKDSAVEFTKLNQAYGTTTTSTQDSDDIKIKDENQQQTYTFKTIVADQTVNTPGVPYKAQKQLVAYKRFGQSVAIAGFWCQQDAWESKKAEFSTQVGSFIVKTEK
ncbi:MAG TPA: hypothetical protein VFO38_03385 [Candidatus Saccharimonadales bacterium]|nr:hypothetical protein [Candidatus Saccharimonadales bacterium]